MGGDAWSGWIESTDTGTCMPVAINLAGFHGRFHGTYGYGANTAGAYCRGERTEQVTVTVTPDGSTAVVTPAAAGVCGVCGAAVWTRQQVTTATTADPLTGDWRAADAYDSHPVDDAREVRIGHSREPDPGTMPRSPVRSPASRCRCR
jgi:hypothetical protein